MIEEVCILIKINQFAERTHEYSLFLCCATAGSLMPFPIQNTRASLYVEMMTNGESPLSKEMRRKLEIQNPIAGNYHFYVKADFSLHLDLDLTRENYFYKII